MHGDMKLVSVARGPALRAPCCPSAACVPLPRQLHIYNPFTGTLLATALRMSPHSDCQTHIRGPTAPHLHPTLVAPTPPRTLTATLRPRHLPPIRRMPIIIGLLEKQDFILRMFHKLEARRRYGVEPRAITFPIRETFVTKSTKFQEAPRHIAVNIYIWCMFVA